MKIIELHKRRKSLYGVEMDVSVDPEEYGAEVDPVGFIALDMAVCDEYGIKRGTDITTEKLAEVIDASYFSRAKRRALWYLEQRDLSKKQLIEKLSRSFPETTAIKVADRLEELSLIDDARYASRLANSLVFDKKVSPKYAAYLMTTKGIDRETAREFTENIEVDQIEIIKDILSRRYQNRLGSEKELNRAIGYLARRGFSFSDIKTALKDFGTELQED